MNYIDNIGDVIGAILIDDNDIEIDQYYNLALLTILDLEDENLSDNCKKLLKKDIRLSLEMKRISFLIILNRNPSIKEFVCQKENKIRSYRRELDVGKTQTFFLKLSVICEEYMDLRINESRMIEKVKNAYLGKEEVIECDTVITVKKRKRKNKKTKNNTISV